MVDDHNNREQKIRSVVEALCNSKSYEAVAQRPFHEMPMPSVDALRECVELLRSIIFPGYFGVSEITPGTAGYYMGAALDRVARILAEQVKYGYCFTCPKETSNECIRCEERASAVVDRFIGELPRIRHLLVSDVQAAFEGDPAAPNYGEVIFSYPSIRAMTNHRIAHALNRLEVDLIPRIISETAHSEVGIDIHPGAEIGERFFMDHGTGVVIGETSEIGNNVRIYQNTTLGAVSFPLDEHGNPIKGIKRHPIVEDDVIIYSNVTILGRVTIGRGSVIGGNVWLTRSVPPKSRIILETPKTANFENGSGI